MLPVTSAERVDVLLPEPVCHAPAVRLPTVRVHDIGEVLEPVGDDRVRLPAHGDSPSHVTDNAATVLWSSSVYPERPTTMDP